MEALLKKPLPPIPMDIQKKLDASLKVGKPPITLTSFTDKEAILYSLPLQQEVGFAQFPGGSWLVSMTCPMPGITPEMIEWWFWWHCQDPLRYQIWFPGSHLYISYPSKDKRYFEQPAMPPFRPNTQRPVEKIGPVSAPLQIDFVTPESFGFSGTAMQKNHIPLIVCGHVSAFRGLVPHTEMAHIFRQTEDGLFLSSRFWLGGCLPSCLRSILRRRMTGSLARGMAEHCCIEYRNLTEILPELYNRYRNR